MFGFIFWEGFFFVNGKLLRVAVFFRTTQWSTRIVSFWKGNLPTEPLKASWIKRTLEFFPWGGGVNHFDFFWLFPPTSTVRWGGTVFRDLDRLEDLVMQTLQTLQDPASMSFFFSDFFSLPVRWKERRLRELLGLLGFYFQHWVSLFPSVTVFSKCTYCQPWQPLA